MEGMAVHHPYRSSLLREFAELKQELQSHFSIEEEVRKLKVDIIRKVEGNLVEDVARASGIQDSQAFKDARLTLSECERELEKLRSLTGDIEPSENMAMTGKYMELKERSDQLKAQKKKEK